MQLESCQRSVQRYGTNPTSRSTAQRSTSCMRRPPRCDNPSDQRQIRRHNPIGANHLRKDLERTQRDGRAAKDPTLKNLPISGPEALKVRRSRRSDFPVRPVQNGNQAGRCDRPEAEPGSGASAVSGSSVEVAANHRPSSGDRTHALSASPRGPTPCELENDETNPTAQNLSLTVWPEGTYSYGARSARTRFGVEPADTRHDAGAAIIGRRLRRTERTH
jgi:hypothetical protein